MLVGGGYVGEAGYADVMTSFIVGMLGWFLYPLRNLSLAKQAKLVQIKLLQLCKKLLTL